MRYNVAMQEETKQPISYGAIWRMLEPVVRPFYPLIWAVAFVSALIAALHVAEPYIYGRIIDSVTQSVGDAASVQVGLGRILPYIVAWVAVLLAASALIALQAWLAWYIGNQLNLRAGERVLQKYLALSVGRFQDERAGAMLSRFNATDEALWTLNNQLFRSLSLSIFTFVMIVSIGFLLDWRLMAVSLAVVPFIIAIGVWNLHVSMKRQDIIGEKWEETAGLVGDAFSNITTVQSEAGEDRMVTRFVRAFLRVLKEQLKINITWAGIEAGTGGVYIFGRLLLFFAGIRFVLSGETSLGTLIMFLGFAGFLFGSVQQVMAELPMAARSLNRLGRAARIFEEVPEVRDREGARKAPALKGEVEFDNVWFGYRDGQEHVLRGVSFTIPAGKTFALVGESGAGKSTLAKLMVRFADPTRGAIKVDGTDLRDFTLSSLRPQVGFVMQENLLFHDSILYNVKFAKPNASRDDVIAAAKRAQAHEFISKLPKGYDTVVGERGVKLSGGQKQRIALARVLLANPPILVLDEATSALDSKTEHDLQQALREVKKGRTTIVIAHRLSTVMDADNILVMAKGRIVDQGRHEDLIKRGGIYRQFWDIQAGGYV
jgi:ATP-binding cassette subfamily B protein